MRIVVFNAFFPPAYLGGGPIRTIAAMLSSAPRECAASVITTNTDLGRGEPLAVVPNQWQRFSEAQVYYCSMEKLRSYLKALREARDLQPDAVYLNSFFDPKFSIIPQWLFRLKWLDSRILAIAPRGEFSAGAMAIRGFKKSLYIWAFKRSGLASKVVWHASATAESEDIKRVFGANVSIIIRENDTLLPPRALEPVESPAGPLRAVSLSRLSPKKGIHTLLEGLREANAPIELDIIGPPEDKSYHERCLKLVEPLPESVSVRFLGALPHEEIRSRLSQYDVMLCPTKGENFGHVIAEALSASCPVLCADVTPWSERLRAGGGEVVSPNDAGGWALAVDAYAQMSVSDRMDRRRAAGVCYNEWRAANPQPHFFSLLKTELGRRNLTNA